MRKRTLAALLLLTASPALAQESPPDLSGFWSPDYIPETPPQEMLDKVPDDAGLLEDSGVPEYPRGEFGGLKLKPETLAHAEKWTPETDMTVARVCMAPSIVYSIQGPFPWEIYQTPELIVFKYEYFDQIRVIFMDGRDHPPADAPHSKMGHSVGHWEGDELVIDTTHILPSTITNNGLDHSENIHMVERYRLIEGEDGKQKLVATQWFEDPELLDNSGLRYISWEKRPGQRVFPYDCDPTFALEFQAAEAEKGTADQ